MTHEPSEIPDDPLGCRDDLRGALADPDMCSAGPSGERAAYRLAVALGRCRLFGVVAGDLDGVMPPALAVAAAAELVRLLPDWTAEADQLGQRWDAELDPAEADDLCGGLLHLRMEAWTATLALDEAYADAAKEEPDGAPALRTAVERCREALVRFDAALEGQTEILATVSGTNLLDNWRTLLAPPFIDEAWWLDGRLEEAAREADAEAARTLPGAGVWSVLRRLAGQVWGEAPQLAPVGAVLGRAALPGATVAVPGQMLCWLSPDGIWRGELQLPEQFTPEEESRDRPLNFTRRADNQPATELVGRRVWLAGAEYTVDDQARVKVHLADLRGDRLNLAVGPPPQAWAYAPQGD